MTVTVQLIEATNGVVTKITELCQVKGAIPVYRDKGGAAKHHERELPGCAMRWKGKILEVSVKGAMAVSRGPVTYATASVSAVPLDARPLCPDMCGPQPLADSTGEIKVSGAARALEFSLTPNPVSMLNARPTAWLEALVTTSD